MGCHWGRVDGKNHRVECCEGCNWFYVQLETLRTAFSHLTQHMWLQIANCPPYQQALIGQGGRQSKEICVLGGPGGPLNGMLKPVRFLVAPKQQACAESPLNRIA